MINHEAFVPSTAIVGGGLRKTDNIFDFKERTNAVSDEVLPPTYRDNGLTNGEERVMADIERRKLRERIKTF